MNSIETIKFERGKVIGEEAGVLWESVDLKERYHAAKRKIFRHAFVSPFEATEMLMGVNGEKEPKFRTRPGTAGGKKTYATLNIMKDEAVEQIEYQMRKDEKDDEVRLLEHFASSLRAPAIAYLRGGGFKGEFQENGLINGYTYEALSECIYVGTKRKCGGSEQRIHLSSEYLPMPTNDAICKGK